MGAPATPPPVKRIAGLLGASLNLLAEARAALESALAPLTAVSDADRWSVSSYYAAEMGSEIWRQYVVVDGLMAPEQLVALKLEANALEQRWARGTRRPVNIDPGYIDLNRLVLASTKDASHRLYLGQGIYAEVTLRYVDGAFAPLAHTYADYAMPATRAFFSRARAAYRSELAAVRRAVDRHAR